MAPNLLPAGQMQGLQCFFSALMAGKAGPVMVPSLSTELGLGQVVLGLMQPIGRSIHLSILGRPTRRTGMTPIQ